MRMGKWDGGEEGAEGSLGVGAYRRPMAQSRAVREAEGATVAGERAEGVEELVLGFRRSMVTDWGGVWRGCGVGRGRSLTGGLLLFGWERVSFAAGARTIEGWKGRGTIMNGIQVAPGG